MKEAYNIGLDIGTSSVGYAMTDEKGRLLRFHKRPTYGSVLFEEAQTAPEAFSAAAAGAAAQAHQIAASTGCAGCVRGRPSVFSSDE